MTDPEIIDIGSLSDIEIPSHGSGGTRKSVNFGGGLELLMNDKMKSGGGGNKGISKEINLDDLNDLEDELNDIPHKLSNDLVKELIGELPQSINIPVKEYNLPYYF